MSHDALLAELVSGRRTHAYLLIGPDAGRLRQAARLLAQSFNCLQPGPGGPCGTCSPCDAIERGAFPDLAMDRPRLKIGEVREQLALLAERPVAGRRRIVVLPDAAQMTREAQNMLLKRLEEPPSSSVLILTNPSLEGLLPTVVSRCRLIALGAAGWQATLDSLQAAGAVGPDAAFAALAAEGNLELAAGLAARDDLHVLRSEAVRFVTGACGRQRMPPLELVDKFADRLTSGEATSVWLAALGAVLRAALAAAAGSGSLAATAFEPDEWPQIAAIEGAAAARLASALEQVRAAVARYASGRLAIEGALLQMELETAGR